MEETDPSLKLFFVHVPRFGGTNLMKARDVPIKVMENRSLWKRITNWYDHIFFPPEYTRLKNGARRTGQAK